MFNTLVAYSKTGYSKVNKKWLKHLHILDNGMQFRLDKKNEIKN